MTTKTRNSTLILMALLTLATASAFSQTEAQKAFATIKALPGNWVGDTSMGPVQVNFKITAGGSAVMSEILGKEDMVSMFNLDGAGRLLMTHYCAAGNDTGLGSSLRLW